MEHGPGLKMYFLLKIFENVNIPASYVIVYQRDYIPYTLGCLPAQDSSPHQNMISFLED